MIAAYRNKHTNKKALRRQTNVPFLSCYISIIEPNNLEGLFLVQGCTYPENVLCTFTASKLTQRGKKTGQRQSNQMPSPFKYTYKA